MNDTLGAIHKLQNPPRGGGGQPKDYIGLQGEKGWRVHQKIIAYRLEIREGLPRIKSWNLK